ncbi:hypothetical protein F0562_023633 [Nyssa sinensis]|uniref:Uncharacterized protein n=1 Tax=Nyssa sinensis TaxID=561372 RepID=A0A5J5BM99_9ASTE|nr:hypothetical protein F0562_023633 [Nyssa sinensis]
MASPSKETIAAYFLPPMAQLRTLVEGLGFGTKRSPAVFCRQKRAKLPRTNLRGNKSQKLPLPVPRLCANWSTALQEMQRLDCA